MKRFSLLVLIGIFAFCSTNVFARDLVATGAGYDNVSTSGFIVDGQYIENGTSNGKPQFQGNEGHTPGSDNHATLISWDGSKWIIEDRASSNGALYTNTNDTPLAPQTGWVSTNAAYNPPPTLSGEGTSEVDGSLPVELAAFAAIQVEQGIVIKWKTESESNNLGYNVYRAEQENRMYVKLNGSLIDGLGNSSSGQEYSFIDRNTIPGKFYYYKLEDVDYFGNSNFYGPVSVITTGIEKAELLPTVYCLLPNFPNLSSGIYNSPKNGIENSPVWLKELI